MVHTSLILKDLIEVVISYKSVKWRVDSFLSFQTLATKHQSMISGGEGDVRVLRLGLRRLALHQHQHGKSKLILSAKQRTTFNSQNNQRQDLAGHNPFFFSSGHLYIFSGLPIFINTEHKLKASELICTTIFNLIQIDESLIWARGYLVFTSAEQLWIVWCWGLEMSC